MIRYGIELEGRHKGLSTVVVIGTRQHDIALVDDVLAARGLATPAHAWIEREAGEEYAWDRVARFCEAMKVTVLVFDDRDLPPAGLAGKVSLVWRVPSGHEMCATSCSHAQIITGTFKGFEVALSQARSLDTAEYAKDIICR